MTQTKPPLHIAPCKAADARVAVERWHYAPRMPVGRLVPHGVWEGERWVGVVLYGRGATPNLGTPYGCTSTEVCELVRVALAPGRQHPTTRVLGVSLRMLARMNPGLRLVVSFADMAQGHIGTLYQASNWIYAGTTAGGYEYWYRGRWCHQREITSGAFGKGGAIKDYSALPKRQTIPKHRYLYPFDSELRARLPRLAYPRRTATTTDAPEA